MSIKIMTLVWDMDLGNPIQKLVALKLADNANDSGVCWPSLSKIASQCNCSTRSVSRHIEALSDMGLLEIGKSKGRHNVYKFKTIDRESLVTESLVTIDRESLHPRQSVTGPVTESLTNHNKPSIEPPNNRNGKNNKLDWYDYQLTEQQKDDIKGIRQACKKKLTQLALNTILKELDLAKNNYGIDYQESIEIWAVRGWTGFKAEWAATHKGVNQNKQASTINNLLNAQLPDLGGNHGQPDTIQAINGGAVIGLPESNDTGNDSNVLDGTWELQP